VTSVTLRMATLDELERTASTDQANLTDGAAAVLVDGSLVGIANEYGTAVYAHPAVDRADIEKLAEAAGNLLSLELTVDGRIVGAGGDRA
jgi:hypothetical protein